MLDAQGILRVGGRLRHSMLNYDEKYPIILPKQSSLTRLIIIHAHHATLHGGPQLTLNYLRQRYWILKGRNMVRSLIRQCIVCFREQPRSSQPIMGNLSAERVTPSRPFLHTGIDYAGPIQFRTSKGRGHKTHKGYIALFICLATRAIHLELVSNYTSEGFIAAYKRFTARRGLCTCLYSDNGTTFRGANQLLKSLFQAASKEHERLSTSLTMEGTAWKFIPPAAPNFGGIWEAGIKSAKYHLRRIIGNHTLTYEEFTTVLTQIEACLNSRPISPLSEDPNDLTPLTPGHFLIGSPLLSIPEPSTLSIPTNRLGRWQLLTNMQEHFWRRWSKEYLHCLQQRRKWTAQSTPAQPGDLALIRDDHLPPAKWSLGRITTIHPGSDGHVRVVTLRTLRGLTTRPVTKISILPTDTSATPATS